LKLGGIGAAVNLAKRTFARLACPICPWIRWVSRTARPRRGKNLAERPAYRSLMPCGAVKLSGYRQRITLAFAALPTQPWGWRFATALLAHALQFGRSRRWDCSRADLRSTGTVTADPWFFGQWYVADLSSETKISGFLELRSRGLDTALIPVAAQIIVKESTA